jgi:phosphoadenosine phosphosulfate reductase
VVFTSFGPSGLVVLEHMSLAGLLPRVPVVTIDTLHLFPETLDFIDATERRLNFSAKRYRPRDIPDRAAFERAHGTELWRRDPALYANLTKVEPTQRALADLDVVVMLTGRRADQGAERAQLALVEAGTVTRVNPIARWTHDEVWSFIRAHGVPYHSLLDQGYASIGDKVTTSKTQPGEAERAGRWAGSEQTECGMHSLAVLAADPVQVAQGSTCPSDLGRQTSYENSTCYLSSASE